MSEKEIDKRAIFLFYLIARKEKSCKKFSHFFKARAYHSNYTVEHNCLIIFQGSDFRFHIVST